MTDEEFPTEPRRRYKLEGHHSYFWTFEKANRAAKGRQILFLDDAGKWVPVRPVDVWLPMTAKEITDEVEWLSEAGMHPAQMVLSIGRAAGTIAKVCVSQGRPDLASPFYAEVSRVEAL
jgi:hypothetical protein